MVHRKDTMTVVPIPSAIPQNELFECFDSVSPSNLQKEQDPCADKDVVDWEQDADPNDDGENLQDHVLVVPKKLTKHAQNILFERRAMPMSWNLEGRFGSRTFRVDEFHMGIPVLDKKFLFEMAARFPDLQKLLALPEVRLRYQSFVEPPEHRTQERPYIDATHHPERAPPEFDLVVAIEESRHAINKNPNPPLFTYAELFAGMGGFGVALDALGGRCIFCSDLEKHLREIYHHNFVTVPNRQRPAHNQIDIPIFGDIYQIPDSAFPRKLDLLVGGFPCQPFSALGEQPGFQCQKAGNLFLEIVRVLKVSRPKAFLLENVPGLLTMTETYNAIVDALQEAGYDVTTEVVSARGVTATGRKRLFFVGLQRDLEPTEITSDNDRSGRRKFQFPFIPDLQLKARDVVDYDELPTEDMKLLRLSDATFAQLLNRGRWRTHSMAWPNKSLDTMTSHYGERTDICQLCPRRMHLWLFLIPMFCRHPHRQCCWSWGKPARP